MTQAQLDSQIARLTGESLTEIHPLGFSLESDHHDDLEPATVRLVLDSVRQTRTTQSSEKPRSIGTARRSHGWGDCAWHSSILDASDKSHIVMGFLSADFGVKGM